MGEHRTLILKEKLPAPLRASPFSLTQLRTRRSSKVRNTQRLGHSLRGNVPQQKMGAMEAQSVHEQSPPLGSSPAAGSAQQLHLFTWSTSRSLQAWDRFLTLTMHHWQGTNSWTIPVLQGHSHPQDSNSHTAGELCLHVSWKTSSSQFDKCLALMFFMLHTYRTRKHTWLKTSEKKHIYWLNVKEQKLFFTRHGETQHFVKLDKRVDSPPVWPVAYTQTWESYNSGFMRVLIYHDNSCTPPPLVLQRVSCIKEEDIVERDDIPTALNTIIEAQRNKNTQEHKEI